MPLDKQQQEKLEKWLQSKGVLPNCPICTTNSWAIGDIVSALPYTTGKIKLGGPTVPMVQIICKNCAHVLLFAAIPIGLVS